MLTFKPGGGESYMDVLSRVKKTVSILKRLNYNKILVVSHGRFNKIFLNHVLGEKINQNLEQDNCCINVMEMKDEKTEVSAVNHII